MMNSSLTKFYNKYTIIYIQHFSKKYIYKILQYYPCMHGYIQRSKTLITKPIFLFYLFFKYLKISFVFDCKKTNLKTRHCQKVTTISLFIWFLKWTKWKLGWNLVSCSSVMSIICHLVEIWHAYDVNHIIQLYNTYTFFKS